MSNKEVYAEYLIENSVDFINVSDKSGRIVEFNPAAQQAFGYSRKEVLELDMRAMYAYAEEFDRVMQSLAQTGKYSGEVTCKRKNGQIFVCHLSATTLYNNLGEAIGVMGVSHYITSGREAARLRKLGVNKNKKLLEQMDQLTAVATSVTNGIVITDSIGRIKWCNRSFEKLTEYAFDELRGNRPSELFKIPHFFKEEYERLVGNGPVFRKPVQVAHYKKGGDLYWMIVESTPVYDRKTGELKQIIEVCTEITDHKRTELALVESEQNLRQIAETIDDVFFLYNYIMKEYQFVSPNCKGVFGVEDSFFYDGREFIKSLVHKDDQHILRNARIALLSEEEYDIEYRITLNGEERWIHERAFLIIDEDKKVIKGAGVASDITDYKRNLGIIAKQHRDISESIAYAQKIQEATLPDLDKVRQYYKDFFVFYKPKSQLSGDFYVLDRVNMRGQVLPTFVVADCTGHGVPGAILSILCNSLVRQTLINREVYSPAEALEVMRRQLISLFRSDALRTMTDGMDIGFCVHHREEKKLYFAGANSVCMVLRAGKWIELKGDKQHVGFSDDIEPFSHVEFEVIDGDRMYLFTDGFADQFGGAKNKKYLRKNVLNFLLKNSDLPMAEQCRVIEEEFLAWKGDYEQTDDVCVLGVEIL